MRRRGGLSLAERAALTAAHEAQPSAKHCWVDAGGGDRMPGLLVEWRRAGDRWEGRVVYAVTADGRSRLVEEWLDATLLQAR